MYEGRWVSDWTGVFESSGLIVGADKSVTEFNAEDDWDADTVELMVTDAEDDWDTDADKLINAEADDDSLWLRDPDEESDTFEAPVAEEDADADPLGDSLWLKVAEEDIDILGVPVTEKERPVDAEVLGDADTLTV